jgi:hypothetical protein
MSSAGLLQLESVGLQDVVLTINPQVTFFKSVHKRHTPFAIETIEQMFNETVDFGRTAKCKVSRAADLIGCIYLHVVLPPLSIPAGSTYVGWTNALGHALIDYVSFSIGGQEIVKHYGVWMEIWDELVTEEAKRNGVFNMIGKYEIIASTHTNATMQNTYNIPLQFWFCRRPDLFLPVVALQHHDIEIEIKFRPFSECITYDGPTPPATVEMVSASFYVDYIYLSNEERRKFSTVPLMYMIDQVQFGQKEQVMQNSNMFKTRLEFNHAVKELHWVFIESDSVENNDHFNFARRADTQNLMQKATLKTENHDRFLDLDETYFRQLQPLKYHTRIPLKYIYSYAFGAKPEEMYPTGTMNFSRYSNIIIQCGMNSNNPELFFYVYALNTNTLVIHKGMAALGFNN